ncbi:MAG TPA: phenylalanine--tRNA ligase subunit beta [Planctomycetota bacterium]|nr:phenylalanine--tRNA ligase subunit beta [Planctomycetota bacterium]
MRVPLSWVKDYVELPGSPADAAKRLVMAGVGVEAVEGDVLDLEITANRSDLLSVVGVAREIALVSGRPFKEPAAQFTPAGAPVGKEWAVEVKAADLCPRYTARLVRNVVVGPSPSWMSARLEAAGIRPVNNVVDVTNYVLLESGQPLHAFDARLLRGKRIVVRRAAAGEKIAAIDGKTYALTPDMLVIADAERPVAIAGVMGGKETEIGPSTVDVLLESAAFDPVSVRRTGRRLALASESSYRFERGVDFDGVDWASRRAVELLVQVAAGQAAEGVVDVSTARPERPTARVRPSRVAAVLGLPVATPRIREILSGLGCQVADTDGAFEVTAPWKRRDLRIEADYIEEVARIEGYDRIPCDTGFGLRATQDSPEDRVREEVRATLAGLGAYEVLTWSFEDAKTPNRIPFWTDGPLLPLRDPQGNVDRTLREAMAPSLLRVLQTNEAYREALHPVFEIAAVYHREGKAYGDRMVLGIAAPGDPLDVKGLLEVLMRRLGVSFEVHPSAVAGLEPGTTAELRIEGRRAGYLGQAPAGLVDLRQPAAVAEVDFSRLVESAKLVRPYRDFNRQPPVDRDLNVVLPDAVRWSEVEALVREAGGGLLESLGFASEYRGKGIEPGKKAWAFSMVFRAQDRTLTGEEADGRVKAILEALKARLGAVQR